MTSSRSKFWLAFIFVLDCTIMPVIKISGVSFKISYLIAFYFVLQYLFRHFNIATYLYKKNVKMVTRKITCFMIVVCFGQLWISLFASPTGYDALVKFMLGCALMIGAMLVGYEAHDINFNFLFYCLMLNNVINMVLALLGRAAPPLLLKIYYISVDTYTEGYYRNGGIIGNPNSTLLIMNMILLCIVVLYKKDMLHLSKLKIILIIIMPILCDIVVSSRGELIQTIIIDIFFVWFYLKKNPNPTKIISTVVVSGVVIVVALFIFNNYFLPKYPNMQISLDRLTTIEYMGNTSGSDVLNTSMRPFYKLDVFSQRFAFSPIWGTGVDACSGIDALLKGTTGYHNDIFMIMASAGIIGLFLWISICKIGVASCGLIMLSPILTSGISNTFIQSWAGTMMYFFIIGCCIRNSQTEDRQANLPRIRIRWGKSGNGSL